MNNLQKRRGKSQALEVGGNNPLIVSQIEDIKAAVYTTIQSAFLTSGQRCSSARRLILPPHPQRDQYLHMLIKAASSLRVGPYTDDPEPFMGPLIHQKIVDQLLSAEKRLIEAGALPLIHMKPLHDSLPFLSPGIVDITAVLSPPDEEYFGPLLQVIYVDSFEQAIDTANDTHYGLSASLISSSQEEWGQFYQQVRAGVINWNTPTTGASSQNPFGGIGKSGNHRPSAFFAADYCSYPVASSIKNPLQLPLKILPGINL